MSQKQVEQLIAVCGHPVAGHLLTQAALTKATHEDRVVEIRMSSTPVGDGASFTHTRSWGLTSAGEVQRAYLVFPRPIPFGLRRGSVPGWEAIEAVFAAFGVNTHPVPLHERFPSLVTAVVSAPDDEGPRRVLADALLELSDPRGELIAVQCEGTAPDTEARLLRDHAAAWRAELGLEGHACELRRGFVEQVTVHGDASALASAWAHTPVRRLVLIADDALEAVLALPLTGLRGLAIEGCAVTEKAVARLAGHPVAAGLEALELTAVSGIDACWRALAKGEWPQLKVLAVARCGLGGDAVTGLRRKFGATFSYSAV